MDLKRINASIEEAEKFIKRANDCKEELAEITNSIRAFRKENLCSKFKADVPTSYTSGTNKSGALRRQSMELSRSLSNLRKSNVYSS